jgi:hypothetical protein
MLQLIDMTRQMAAAEVQRFGPAFAAQLPQAAAVAVCRLHKLFGQMLLAWVGTVDALVDEQVEVSAGGWALLVCRIVLRMQMGDGNGSA